MTASEFNEKYKDYLEEGFDGMEIENEEIIDVADRYFKIFTEYLDFSYAQIKNKFGTSRVYCDNVDWSELHELEKNIDRILIRLKNGKRSNSNKD